jgi:hypothetical protein
MDASGIQKSKKAAQGRYFRAFQAPIVPDESRYGAADETLIPGALLVFLHEGDFPAMGNRKQCRPRMAREHHAGLRSAPVISRTSQTIG